MTRDWKSAIFTQAYEGAHGGSDRHEQHVGAGAAVPLLQDARLRREQQARRLRARQITHSLAWYDTRSLKMFLPIENRDKRRIVRHRLVARRLWNLHCGASTQS